MNIHDITVPVSTELPVYPGDGPIELEQIMSLEKGDIANVTRLACSTHVGTHVDPPSHFIPGAMPLDELPLETLIGQARVVDVGDVAAIDAEVLRRCDLDGATRVLFKTRNSEFWPPTDNVFREDFVYIEPDAAQLLVDCGVQLVGIDYLSVEKFNFDEPKTHLILLGAGVIVVEGLALRDVAPGDYELLCLPLKIKDGDGAPARVVLRN
ncbi:MAG TPA: cyclase family protein [Blastocatellia bacterium]|nr:cyclase family protein [Blastocatellia bacterium]HMX26572.1 cyclase family protein [Blastocatellia bacterium]HMY72187.1 cyclase family protein [Blastocatellia bacterium]HMZ21744.1 cyclase family protein [Blastocatellia bacterium]HNG29566.1 cyclase family protein [Blastocatellia bacterium]